MTLTRKMDAAVQDDRKAAKRVLKYIKGKSSLGTNFGRGNFELQAYSDASFSNPTLGNRSASRYLVTPGGGLIVCGSKLQRVTAESTCEAELLALSTAVKHTACIRGLPAELGFKQSGPIPIRCDDRTACIITQTGNFMQRTTRIALRMARIAEISKQRETTIYYSCLEKVDMPTKVLPRI